MSVKTGLTIGVWDLIHEGHLNLLKKCKDYCDYLFVGVVSDFFVRVQKGHDRPFHSLEQRIENVRNTNLSNKIVVIDTLDVLPYLQMVDVWLKGSTQKNMRPYTWTNEIYIERTPNISTTDLLNKIRKPISDEC